MESKGRRSLRASGTGETPVEPVKSPQPRSGEGAPSEAEPPTPAELTAEAANPAQTAVEIVTAAAAAVPAPSPPAPRQTTTVPAYARELNAPLEQSQAALSRGLEAMSAELAGLALSAMSLAASTATKLLAVKTLADAVEVNAGFACGSFDAAVSGSAKLSELGMKLAAEVSQPLLGELGKNWSKQAQLGG